MSNCITVEAFIGYFSKYCEDKFFDNSGAPSSYARSISILLQYMGVSVVSLEVVSEIRSLFPDIKNSKSAYYNALFKFYSEKGCSSYVKDGFLKAALQVLFDFCKTIKIDNNKKDKKFLVSEIIDDSIISKYNIKNLSGLFPKNKFSEHSYKPRKVNGNSEAFVCKIKKGRAAEKYFISFLEDYIGLTKDKDFYDVANNKDYDFDIRLFDVGLEIKNVGSGSFYLTDNEIARIETSKTFIVLVAINCGIWLLNSSSNWLKERIKNIREIREYCRKEFINLDLTDIKIALDNTVLEEAKDISYSNRDQLLKLLN